MKITVHRGTHQVGGIAAEISTETARIIIDMGDELSLDADFVSAPLNIDGVTNTNGCCDAVLFTHYHSDHTGQMNRVCADIPIYAGALAKDVMFSIAQHRSHVDSRQCNRIKSINTFVGGDILYFRNIKVTVYSIDHSACDSYLFLIEVDNRKVLYTGDFRMHGFRGKALQKILKKIGKIDVLITEGTTVSRNDIVPLTEYELQQKIKKYLSEYKYVFVLCASTNLERICAFSKAVPKGKYFICDNYQKELLNLVEKHWGKYSELYRDIKVTTYGDNILSKISEKGFLMMVRDNRTFRKIIENFDADRSIMIYSMWDGYRLIPESTIPDFLNLSGSWETLHTSGHASRDDLKFIVDTVKPDVIIPIHTDKPEIFMQLCPDNKVVIAEDGKEIVL